MTCNLYEKFSPQYFAKKIREEYLRCSYIETDSEFQTKFKAELLFYFKLSATNLSKIFAEG